MFGGRRRIPWPWLALAVSAAAIFFWRQDVSPAVRTVDWSSPPLAPGEYECLSVLAPDRLQLRRPAATSNGHIPVRLLGVSVDDPPSSAEAERAAGFLRDRLSQGRCQLEFDKRRIDRKGSYLAYVYVGETLLNEQLLRAGLMRLDVRPDDSAPMVRRLSQAESEAQAAGRGLWAAAQPNSK